jgi:hypothetical protein
MEWVRSVSATILLFDRDQALTNAWNAYAEHAARSKANPDLLLNRQYVDEWARLEDRYKKLVLLTEGA